MQVLVPFCFYVQHDALVEVSASSLTINLESSVLCKFLSTLTENKYKIANLFPH